MPSTKNMTCQPCDARNLVADVDEPAGQRRAHHLGERLGQVEDGEHLHADLVREPGRQEHDDAREQAGLGDAQQEPQDDEGRLTLHEGEARRDDAPGDGDAGEPDLGAELGQQQVAGDLEQGVADEEDTGAQGVGAGGDSLVHLQRSFGEANVGAVQEGHHVQDDEHWHEPPGRFGNRRFQDRRIQQLLRGIGGNRH